MSCLDRSGNEIKQNNVQNKIFNFLYKNKLGRIMLKLLVKPWVSYISGVVLNSSYTRIVGQDLVPGTILAWNLGTTQPLSHVSVVYTGEGKSVVIAEKTFYREGTAVADRKSVV